MWLLCINFNEIYLHFFNAQLNSLFRKWVYIAELLMYRDRQNYLNALWSLKGKSSKSILTWLLWIKFNEIYVRYLEYHRK